MSEHVDSQQPGPSNEALMKTDWSKCLLCQEVTSEILRCPAESKCLDVGGSYFTKQHGQMAQILSLKIQYHKVKAGRKENIFYRRK